MAQKQFTVISLLLMIIIGSLITPVAAQDDVLTVYSGRSESLIAPLLEQFTADTGIEVEVLYGSTSAVANQILIEGDNSPADVFISQDGGALGALAAEDMLTTLPDDVLEQVVSSAFVSPDGVWVGISGRARVMVYNPELLEEAGLELPESILDLTDEAWAGLIGWAPTNASFVSNITAMRVLLSDEETEAWLADMIANDVQPYESNTPIVQATIDGEIIGGLVNHYYLYRFIAEDPEVTAQLHFFPGGDLGSLINIAGAGILTTTDQEDASLTLINYLLSESAQTYFATETFEYPMIEAVEPSVDIPALADIEAPEIDLSDLKDLQGTLDMIDDSGALD
jgi:iron(III) transport system substrate-binding protein